METNKALKALDSLSKARLRIIVASEIQLMTWEEQIRQALANKDGDGWRPIESAPKDGTKILCYNKEWKRTYVGFYKGTPYNEWRHDNWVMNQAPDYWQPLPQPPEEE